MMTPYSVLAALIWSNLFILVLLICRRNTQFVIHFGTAPLLSLFAGGLLRCFVPLDFAPYTRVISMPGWFTEANAFLDRPLFGLDLDLYGVLVIVWAAGALFLLFRIAWELWENALLVSRLKETEDPRLLKALEQVSQQMRVRNARLVQTRGVSVPMLLFQRRPTVLLPDIDYTDRELEYVLRHELFHWKNRDPWVKLLLQFYCALFWWNPLVYLLRRSLQQTLELKCDLSVTGNLPEAQRLEYLETMLKTMRWGSQKDQKRPSLAASEFSSGGIKQRFHLILDYKPHPVRQKMFTLFFALIIALTLALSFAFVAQPCYPAPEEDITSDGGTELTPENCYLVKSSNGDYLLYVPGDKNFPQAIPEYTAQELRRSGFPLRE